MLDSLAAWRGRLIECGFQPQSRLLWVDVATQELLVLEDSKVVRRYPVSTALKGTGCSLDSYQTPTGLHQISEKIGDNEVTGAVFRGRQVTGEVASIESKPVNTGQDLITTRILWLSGMEPGINQGEGVDSHDRYIYIHGTNEEGRIGQPVSHGCIRMLNSDIISLFDSVSAGTPVIIE